MEMRILSELSRRLRRSSLRRLSLLTTLDEFLFELLDRGGPIFAFGSEYYLNPDDIVTRKKLKRYGGDELKLREMLLEEIRPGDCFVDVGAHYGYYTVPASEGVGKSGTVLAVEPDPHNAMYLRRTINANDLRNVTIVDAALSDTSGTDRLYQSDHRGEVSLRDQSAHGSWIEVETIRADEALSSYRCNVLKIDVEGAEPLVLKGASELLRERPPRVIAVEVNTDALEMFGFEASDVLRPLAQAGYKLARVDEDKNECVMENKEEIAAYASDYYREINVLAFYGGSGEEQS